MAIVACTLPSWVFLLWCVFLGWEIGSPGLVAVEGKVHLRERMNQPDSSGKADGVDSVKGRQARCHRFPSAGCPP